MKTLIPAALTCAIVVAVVAAVEATGQSQPATQSTEHFYVKFLGATNGTPSFRPGRSLTAHSAVFDRRGGRRLGRTSELCTTTVRKPFTMQCSFSAILGSNTFTLTGGLNPSRTPYHAALVGGTGRYAGAHGELLAQSAKGMAEEWTITYTR